MLRSIHGLAIRRATADVDIAVAVEDWAAYESLRSPFPRRRGDPEHRIRIAGLPIDLVPFGGVETPDRTIVWPPAGDSVMSAFGLAEALATAEHVRLAPDITIRVASLPAQTILKFAAWDERHLARPRHDSVDLQMIMKAYSDAWNVDRLYSGDGVAVLERAEYDLELAGAMLLGVDVRSLLTPRTLGGFRELVATAMRETGGLADDMRGDRDANERLLRAFFDGLA